MKSCLKMATKKLLIAFLLTYSCFTSLSPKHSTVHAGTFWNPVVRTCVVAGSCAVILGGAPCLKIVTTGDECLVERFGQFNRRLGPGWHLVLRPFESVSFHGTTREQVLDVPPQQCYTLDNAPLKADAVVYLKIVSMEMARYEVENLSEAILNLCLTQLREEVGKLTLDESFSSRDRINRALLLDLNEVCRTWGVQITRVEIQNLEPSPDILAAMELQMAAERRKRASILKSEGERMTLINEAEGRASAQLANAKAMGEGVVLAANAEKARQKIEAEGLKIAIETVAEAIGDRMVGDADHDINSKKGQGKFSQTQSIEKAMEFLALIRYLETQARFAAGNGTKVLMFPSKDCLPLTHEGLRGLLD